MLPKICIGCTCMRDEKARRHISAYRRCRIWIFMVLNILFKRHQQFHQLLPCLSCARFPEWIPVSIRVVFFAFAAIFVPALSSSPPFRFYRFPHIAAECSRSGRKAPIKSRRLLGRHESFTRNRVAAKSVCAQPELLCAWELYWSWRLIN